MLEQYNKKPVSKIGNRFFIALYFFQTGDVQSAGGSFFQ